MSDRDEDRARDGRKKADADEVRRRTAEPAGGPPGSLKEAVRRAARKHEEERGRAA
ncbi:hypothetical protein [Streptomyces luteireticuli]|uniref:DUF3606 domain-containing protein n=1 Tax=Streptomyces luteireticuli TaxID=173858 RepID=A0ABP3I2X1_9ACTN